MDRQGADDATGISVSGSDVWIVDSGTDRAYRYAGAASLRKGNANATSNFALATGNTNPQDLVTDGNTVWVPDSASPAKVYAYGAGNGTAVGNWTIDPANTLPTGITLDPTGASSSLWICDGGTDRVYEYVNGRARLAGSQGATVSFPLNSANGNPQGIADPPVNAVLTVRSANVEPRFEQAPAILGRDLLSWRPAMFATGQWTAVAGLGERLHSADPVTAEAARRDTALKIVLSDVSAALVRPSDSRPAGSLNWGSHSTAKHAADELADALCSPASSWAAAVDGWFTDEQ